MGGAEGVVEMQEEGLRNAGHEVFVVTTKPDGKMENNENIYRFKPMNLFYYKELNKRNVILKILWHIVNMFNLHSYYQIEQILKKEKPDLVITHNLMGIGFLIPLLIKTLGIKHIHLLHDVQLVVPSGLIIKGQEDNFLVSGLPTKVYGLLCKWLFGSPSRVVSPSKWLMDFHVNRGFFRKSHRLILKNPINNYTSKNSLLTTHSRTNDYLFIGQMENHKGIEWLVNFWGKNSIENKLFVVGDGSLQFESKDNIEFLGRLSGDKLTEVFEKVDFLIMPSLCYENSPTVISMAYQHGTPVVCANIGGAGELVKENETGYLFEPGVSESLLKVLGKCSKLKETSYSKMREFCFNERENYNLDRYIIKLLNI